jgi:hypothetical protein
VPKVTTSHAYPVNARGRGRRGWVPSARLAALGRVGRIAGAAAGLAAAVVLAYLFLVVVLASGPRVTASTGGELVRADTASLITTARAAAHLRVIPESAELDAIAATRARQITTDFAHHLIPVPAASVWGEVIAWDSYPTRIAGAQAVAMFLGSPDHRRVVLGRWTAYGVGVASAGGRWYVVGIFASWPLP